VNNIKQLFYHPNLVPFYICETKIHQFIVSFSQKKQTKIEVKLICFLRHGLPVWITWPRFRHCVPSAERVARPPGEGQIVCSSRSHGCPRPAARAGVAPACRLECGRRRPRGAAELLVAMTWGVFSIELLNRRAWKHRDHIATLVQNSCSKRLYPNRRRNSHIITERTITNRSGLVLYGGIRRDLLGTSKNARALHRENQNANNLVYYSSLVFSLLHPSRMLLSFLIVTSIISILLTSPTCIL
jgi:hypothetical protein